MSGHENNIFPNEYGRLSRTEKEHQLQQNAAVFWLTGLSGAGKTTIAQATEKLLWAAGKKTILLDGDNIRSGINNDLGFSLKERAENIRRVAHIARLLLDNGVIVLVSFISPTKEIREKACNIIGADDFYEVYINASLETCEERDTKGLYQKARAGELANFTGISSVYEAPTTPCLRLNTDAESVQDSIEKFNNFINLIVSQK